MKGILTLIIIAAVCLWIVVGELKLEYEEQFYQCYTDREYRGLVSGFMCKGIASNEKCQKCTYYKQFRAKQQKGHKNDTST